MLPLAGRPHAPIMKPDADFFFFAKRAHLSAHQSHSRTRILRDGELFDGANQRWQATGVHRERMRFAP